MLLIWLSRQWKWDDFMFSSPEIRAEYRWLEVVNVWDQISLQSKLLDNTCHDNNPIVKTKKEILLKGWKTLWGFSIICRRLFKTYLEVDSNTKTNKIRIIILKQGKYSKIQRILNLSCIIKSFQLNWGLWPHIQS